MNENVKSLAGKLIRKEGWLWKTLRAAYNQPGGFARQFYRSMTRNGVFYREEELWMCSLQVPQKLQKILDLFSPRSVLDLGCGTGQSLDFFLAHGVDAVGIEASALAISRARHPERIQQFNLNEELDLHRKFDLVWCFEVAEHIHPKYARNLVRSMCNHSERIVLSAAPPGQGGEGHLNEQPPSYWIRLFDANGYAFDEANSAALQRLEEQHSQNMLTFRR